MELNSRIRRIMESMLKKTQANQLNWESDRENADACFVNVHGGRAFIVMETPNAEPERIKFGLKNFEGRSAGAWVVEDGDSDWPLASDLYNWALIKARGGDSMLQELERRLGISGQVEAEVVGQ